MHGTRLEASLYITVVRLCARVSSGSDSLLQLVGGFFFAHCCFGGVPQHALVRAKRNSQNWKATGLSLPGGDARPPPTSKATPTPGAGGGSAGGASDPDEDDKKRGVDKENGTVQREEDKARSGES